MKRFTALLLVTTLLLTLLSGCTSDVVDLTQGTGRRSVDVPPDAPSTEPISRSGGEPDYYEPSSAIIADFGIELLERSREGGANTLVSPLSVVCALAMTMNGAEGDTLTQMQDTLGMSRNALNAFLSDYMENLPEEETYKLSLANSIWFRDDEKFTVEQDFLDINEEFYSAQLYQAPFDSSTVKEINEWVDEHTDGMIKKIIEEITPETMMYLINALAFDAEWQSIYSENQVREGVFTREDGVQNDVELMYSSEHTYLEDEYATGFVKYYDDMKYAFVGLLPNEGVSVEAYVDWLSGEHIAYLLENAQSHEVRAAIPKFESEFSVGMSSMLQEMGMVDAFSGALADFSGIGGYEDENLFISEVLHKTFIEVDERGTKAGAVTAVVFTAESAAVSARVEPKTVYLDRPFVYMLIDCEQNLPFFIGTAENIGEANGSNVDPIVDDGLELDEDALCGYPTVDAMNEVEWHTVETRADHLEGVVTMSVDLPSDWECETITDANEDTRTEFGFEFKPEGEEGSIRLMCYDMFGVCGTDLTEEKVSFDSGYNANVGYYGSSDMWTFVAYDAGSEEFDFVAENNGMSGWYHDYEDTVWEILGRAKFEVEFSE